MKPICSNASQDEIRAFYVLGQLIIWAKGQKPTPCHEVRIERWPYRIYPPQYQIVACVDQGVVCPDVVVDYKTVSAFKVSAETLDAMEGHAVVHHRDGAERVPVKVIELPEAQEKLLGVEKTKDISGVPAAFTSAGGEAPFPFLLAKLIESGLGEDIEFLSGEVAKPHTATGYSNAFSFTEAFQDAVAHLPPDANPFPDKLTNVRVVSVGANYGGIAGLHRMYVTVLSFY